MSTFKITGPGVYRAAHYAGGSPIKEIHVLPTPFPLVTWDGYEVFVAIYQGDIGHVWLLNEDGTRGPGREKMHFDARVGDLPAAPDATSEFGGPGFYREQWWSPEDSWQDRVNSEVMVLPLPAIPFHTDYKKRRQWVCIQRPRERMPYAFTVCDDGREPFRCHIQLGTRLGDLDMFQAVAA